MCFYNLNQSRQSTNKTSFLENLSTLAEIMSEEIFQTRQERRRGEFLFSDCSSPSQAL